LGIELYSLLEPTTLQLFSSEQTGTISVDLGKTIKANNIQGFLEGIGA